MVKLKEAFIKELMEKQAKGEISFSRMVEIINAGANNNITESYERKYYAIKIEKREYKGIRLFKFDPFKDHVLQICVEAGKTKKGKSNTVGIYEIARTTFITNYLTSCVIEIKKEEFDLQMKLMFEKLSE